MNSISRFLLASLLLALFSLTSLAAYFSYRDATHEVEELFDAELAQTARVLQSLLQSRLRGSDHHHLGDGLSYESYDAGPHIQGHEATEFGHLYEKKLAFAVWTREGEVLLTSFAPKYQRFRLTPTKGFSQERVGDFDWRTFTLHDRHLELWIKVGQRFDIRAELIGEIVGHTLVPLLLTIPLLALVTWLIVHRGLSPLRRVARQVTERDPDYLQPIALAAVPREIAGVVASVNGLMCSLEQALRRQRRFTADAAHELRTPLAGIRVHAQNLRDGASAADSGTRAVAEQIITGVDRMTRAVEQLLILSRLEHEQLTTERVDLAKVLRETFADQVSHLNHKQLDLALRVDDQGDTQGHPASLAILARNLIDNALRYTPEGGKVEIRLHRREGRLCLQVCDTGPGIPADQRDAVLQRFYRLDGQSVAGSGLGLSIVQEICKQHQGQLQLSDSDLGDSGLCIEVQLPPATA